MAFKELYCVDCGESLGEYNEEYFHDMALHSVIAFNQQSLVHKRHEIVIRNMLSCLK